MQEKGKLNYDNRNQSSDHADGEGSEGEWKRHEEKLWNEGETSILF